MELIRRENVKKEIIALLTRMNGGPAEALESAAQAIIDRIPDAYEWIPVKDASPISAGIYVVTMTCEGWDTEKQEPNGIIGNPYVSTREYCDAEKAGAWRMYDQPEEGLVWSEESGSGPNEKVIAWMPVPGPMPEIAYKEPNDGGNK